MKQPRSISHVNGNCRCRLCVWNRGANLNDIIWYAFVQMLKRTQANSFYLHWCAEFGSKYGRSVLVTQCCSILLDTYYIRTHIFAHRSFKLLSPPTPNSTTEPNNHCVIHIWFLSSLFSFFRFVFVYVYIHNPPIMYTYIYDKFILLFRSLYFHFSVSLFDEYKYFFRVFCLITYINMILWLLN